MQERKRMPLKAAVPIALEVWNRLTDKNEKDALEAVIFQGLRQIQHTEQQKASGRQERYYQANKEKILEKQKKRRLSHKENDFTGDK